MSREHREVEKRVLVCFGQWDNLKSRLIRWITRSSWSHVWIEYYSSRWKRTMVFHSDYKGVMIEPLANFIERRGMPEKRASYKVLADTERGFRECSKYLGKRYGYLTVFLNSVILLLSRVGIDIPKPYTNPNSYVCSKLAGLFLEDCNVVLPWSPAVVWPGKLQGFIEGEKDCLQKVE